MPLFLVAIFGLFVPGLGHALAGRPRLTAAWAAGALVAVLLVLVSVWMVIPAFAVRIVAAVDGVAKVRAARRSAVRDSSMPTARIASSSPISPTWLAMGALGVAIAGTLSIRTFVVEAFTIPSSSMSPTLEIGDHVYVDKLSTHWRAPERGEVIVFSQPCQPDRAFIMRVIATGGDTVEVRCSVVHVNGKVVPATLEDASSSYLDSHGDDRSFTTEISRYRETSGERSYDVFHTIERPARDEQRTRGEPGIEDTGDFPSDQLAHCGTQLDPDSTPSASQQPGTIVETTREPASPCAPYRHFVVPADSYFVLGDNRNNANDSRYWGVVPADHVVGRAIGIWLPFGRMGALD